MTKEELKRAMANDEDIAPAPTKINERRRKYHESLGKHGEAELERIGKGFDGAVNFLVKHGLKEKEIFEALIVISEQMGNPIPAKIYGKLKSMIGKKTPYQSAMEKASERLENPEPRPEPWKKNIWGKKKREKINGNVE